MLGRDSYLWLPYTQMLTAPIPPKAVRTMGSRIVLEDGRELIDGLASWWVAAHGYNHPHILNAIQAQLAQMPHLMLGGFVHEPALKLTERLATLLPGDLKHTFLADSGSNAVEVALKMVRQYWHNLGEPQKNRLVFFDNAYHGDTWGAMSVCDPHQSMHALFGPELSHHLFCTLPRTEAEWNHFETRLEAHSHELGGLIIEPLVQGAGGMRFHPPKTLQRLRELCDHHGILMVLDEIFTGFGRTGTMFACEAANVVPDIICLGKALTGGALSLASVTVRPFVFEAFLSEDWGHCLMHGPTFMGNPLACAAANASLDLFETEPRLEQVSRISKQLEAQLAQNIEFSCVKGVRTLGAIGVVELHDNVPFNAAKAQAAFIKLGVSIRPFGRILYLTPAFTISETELLTLTKALYALISDL